MRNKALHALPISLVIAQIPDHIPKYGSVGPFACQNTGYYYATSYYTASYDKAYERCQHEGCDIIVNWFKKTSGRDYSGYDIGSVNSSPCYTNKDMTATVVWQKYDNTNQSGSNATQNS